MYADFDSQSLAFMAKQPIFDAKLGVWGYELLYRDARAEVDLRVPGSPHQMAESGFVQALAASLEDLEPEKSLLVDASSELLNDPRFHELPKTGLVLQMRESSLRLDAELLPELLRQKAQGLRLAFDDHRGVELSPKLLEACFLVSVDVLDLDQGVLSGLVTRFKAAGCLVLASRVEDEKSFAMAKSLGFDLFQGFFFKRPQVVPKRKLASSEASRMELLRALSNDTMDIKRLSKAVKNDATIAYRLLAYVNSAFFGLSEDVGSIERAILLLGWRRIRNWIRMLILSDMAQGEAQAELSFLAVQRGRFFELASQRLRYGTDEVESLFLMGLFSLLEPMLGLSWKDIMPTLPLESRIKEALRFQKGAYAVWPSMAKAFEEGDWTGLDGIINKAGFDPGIIALSYAEATDWAHAFFEMARSSAGEGN